MSSEAEAIKELRADILDRERKIQATTDSLDRARLIDKSIAWANEQLRGWEENGPGAEALIDFAMWADEQL